MFKYFLNYCNDTTVHGFKYFGEKNRHKTEKCFWIVALFASSLACIYMFYELVDKVKNNPIIEYLQDEATPISEIPFPAVSYCPEIKTIIDDFNYIEIIGKINKNEMQISDLSDEKLNLMHVIGLLRNDEFLLQFNLSLSTDKIMSSLQAVEGYWDRDQEGSFIQKNSLDFAKVITPYGFCYIFNSLDASELFNLNKIDDIFQFERQFNIFEFNNGVKALNSNETYPLKSPTFRMGLHAIFRKKGYSHKFLKHYGSIFDGHLVFIHKNDEIPMKSSKQYYSELNETTSFTIVPQQKVIDEDLYKINLEERNCYLKNEKVLKFFKYYSKNNCEQECLSTETLKACGCVQFFMIRNNSTNICGIYDKNCYERIENKVSESSEIDCQCFPSCNTLNYYVEMKRLSYDGFTHPHKIYIETLPAEIIVKFKENDFFSLVRKKQFSNVDFLSYSGGILGLFAGISVLSIIELFYYFTIRVIVDSWRAWKKRKVSPIELKISLVVSKQAFQKQYTVRKVLKALDALRYFKESSIHGCNHSVDTTRSLFERIFWIGSLSTSMVICGVLIAKLYDQLQNHPIIISMDDNSYDIQNIPFPAITITTEFELEDDFRYLGFNMFSDDEYLDELDEAMVDDGSMIRLISQIWVCKPILLMREYTYENYENNIVPTIHKQAHTGWFKNQTAEWNTYYTPKFAEILTTRGYGFAFNVLEAKELLNVDEVSEDFIYNLNIVLKSSNTNTTKPMDLNYPFTASSRDNDGLTLTIKKNYRVTRSDICHDNGFIIHANDEIPIKFEVTDICEYEFGTTLDVFITPSVITTDESLRSFSTEKRHCYFDDERKLRFYKKYTKNNCEMECVSNHTFQACGCVPFDVIRDKTTRVCGVNEIDSARLAEYAVKFDPSSDILDKCNCLSKCTSIQYNVEYIQTRINKNYGTSADDIQIRIKFKDNEYRPLRRFQQFTVLDFWASCGGLLGLFSGVSALSVVELFYFFSMRYIFNLVNIFRY